MHIQTVKQVHIQSGGETTSMKESPLTKKLEVLCIGPNISDKRLYEIILACIEHEDFITNLVPNPHQIPLAVQYLDRSSISVIGVIAFPLGNLSLEVKRVQIEDALAAGANRIDITMRIESLNAGEYVAARKEAEALCEMAAQGGAQSTLIANLGLLNPEAKIAAVEIAKDCSKGLKTANGMGVDSTIEEIQELRKSFGSDLVITACGSIRLAEEAIDYINAGADRICTPTPFSIITGLDTLNKHWYSEA